ncbi:hypothetical protein AAFN60_09165 [Roseibacillus persicicus]|uniref:hypothetical protein n=1 Tax=Roseibacillus persicicus TaxID=454148 RepID=UPI00398BAB01
MTDTQDIPADELEDLQRLLRLKNYEQPVDGYFEDFLDEFHRRQRAEAVSGKGVSLWTRIADWFNDLGAAKWAIGAGVAYAVLFLAFFGTIGTKDSPGVAKETEDFLPEGSKLQHVELGTETETKPGEEPSERSLEVLPQEF